MKNILVILGISLLSTISVVAQSDHLTFKNIPIDGTIETFIKKMEENGFQQTYLAGDESGAVMEGEFVNMKCEIFILASPKTKYVWKVLVKLPEETSWYSLKSDYFKYKKAYTEKYGKSTDYEFFSKPYYEGDGYELQALRMDKCSYSAFFNTDNGSLSVSIGKEGCIQLSYEDKENANKRSNEKNDTIQEDI